FLPLLLPLPFSTLFPYTTLFRSLSLSLYANQCTPGVKINTIALGGPGAPSGRGFFLIFGTSRVLWSQCCWFPTRHDVRAFGQPRSEEHTSELQSRSDLVCRLLLD